MCLNVFNALTCDSDLINCNFLDATFINSIFILLFELKSMFYCAQSSVELTHLLALVVLGRWLLVEEDILGQLLLKVHGVDGRLREHAQQRLDTKGRSFMGNAFMPTFVACSVDRLHNHMQLLALIFCRK